MYTSFLQIIRLRCVLNCLLFLVSKKWEVVQSRVKTRLCFFVQCCCELQPFEQRYALVAVLVSGLISLLRGWNLCVSNGAQKRLGITTSHKLLGEVNLFKQLNNRTRISNAGCNVSI